MYSGGKALSRHRYCPREGFPQARPPSPAATAPHFPIAAFCLFAAHHHHHAYKSARGQAHSKTLRAIPASRERVSVLECGGPPPLFPLAPVNRQFVFLGTRSIPPRDKKRKLAISFGWARGRLQ